MQAVSHQESSVLGCLCGCRMIDRRTVAEAQEVTAVAARALWRQTELRIPPVVGSASRLTIEGRRIVFVAAVCPVQV